MTPVTIGVVGCGYVADMYRACLALHSDTLKLAGVFDRDPERLAAFTRCWGDRAYRSVADMVSDPEIEIVLNLTDPESHAEVTLAAIAGGKHVYTEKPLGLTTSEAAHLRDAAKEAGVRLSGAPCNLLGESAQTVWKAVRAGRIGRPVLIYAELDDGMVHRARHQDWVSLSGRVWPARGEFETGCTYEHAGYIVTLLAAMFGPVRRVTAFSALLIPEKNVVPPLLHPAPDFSVGVLEFDHGVVARLTNSIVAPYEHRMRIVGEDGTIDVAEPWDYACRPTVRATSQTRLARILERKLGGLGGERLALARACPLPRGRGKPTMDFMRGVAELALALREGRPSRLDADFAVHISEVSEMIQHPERFAPRQDVRSTFAPIAPMEWAR